jgi:uncharacterized protein (TIGR02145 family)
MMIRLKFLLIIIILFYILFTLIQSCKKLEIERVVKIETGEVHNITADFASISGNILDVGENGITQYGHCWSTTKDPNINVTTKTVLGTRYTIGSFNSELNGLLSGNTYYVIAYAISNGIPIYGDTVSFKTREQIKAEFNANPRSGYLPLSVQFTDMSTGSITSWSWNFGDENTSTSQNPLHTYNVQGSYSVTLTVSSANSSDSETKNNYIIVSTSGSAPVAGFTANRTSIIEGESVSFTDQSINVPTAWSWTFGDGGTSTEQNPTNQYNTQGTYTVKLTVSNSYGSDDETKNNYITVSASGAAPVANFTADKTSITEGETVNFTDQSTNGPTSWSWIFGDGGTSSSQNPSHPYNTEGTYNVILTATNSFGSDAETKNNYITVSASGAAPVANFAADKTSITEGETVNFTDQSSNDPTSWSWTFGDGGTSTEKNPSYQYNTEGTYNVTLTATNSFGSDDETKNNYITVGASGSAPVADFTADKTSITEGETVNFTDQSTNDPTSWSWTFGDGGTSTEQNPSYQYNTEGTYNVTLTATNSYGSDYETKDNFVTVELIMNIPCPGMPTLSDVDGNVYHTVQIGSQCWMLENLKTTKYKNGTNIPLVTDDNAWGDLATPGYCWYDNDAASYKNPYGALYNWYVVNTGNLCPTGWHVATDAEWTTLTGYLGGESVAGGKLKSTTHWSSPNTGATNESGFTALPGGSRSRNGTFASVGSRGLWWSSTEDVTGTAWRRVLDSDVSDIYRELNDERSGFSIRCVKD